jgi:hypothetical protein
MGHCSETQSPANSNDNPFWVRRREGRQIKVRANGLFSRINVFILDVLLENDSICMLPC